ncbi:uncharacterized protein LOC144110062 [Amblyomma americanum]
MTWKSLRLVLALAIALIAVASAKSVSQPQKLNTDGAQAPYDYNPLEVVQQSLTLSKGIIAAIIIGVLLVVIGIIVCCVCMCKACAGKKEVHTVVYTGNPNQPPPPQHQQWPPGAQPTTPPQAYCQPPVPPYHPGPGNGQQHKF